MTYIGLSATANSAPRNNNGAFFNIESLTGNDDAKPIPYEIKPKCATLWEELQELVGQYYDSDLDRRLSEQLRNLHYSPENLPRSRSPAFKERAEIGRKLRDAEDRFTKCNGRPPPPPGTPLTIPGKQNNEAPATSNGAERSIVRGARPVTVGYSARKLFNLPINRYARFNTPKHYLASHPPPPRKPDMKDFYLGLAAGAVVIAPVAISLAPAGAATAAAVGLLQAARASAPRWGPKLVRVAFARGF